MVEGKFPKVTDSMSLFNDKSKKEFRRQLRANPTRAEAVLWLNLRKVGAGAKFRRQESIGPFVVDFYCPELRLALEVDGVTHTNRGAYDASRDQYLRDRGVETLRFTDSQVLDEADKTVARISERIGEMRALGIQHRKRSSQGRHPATTPQPPP